ncbi:MAG: Crp/Fnr family transcriptional regulator [Clostridia bacterium]|jgi:CRP/FNR family transcriptional regulator|nr:Crp/Fnr family transcriptional regulator [Clostridia bacterium]
MRDKEQSLTSPSPWFDELNYDWSLLEQQGIKKIYAKHKILFHSGHTVESVFLVKEGRIRLFVNSLDGKEKAIAIIGKNGLLGESSMYQQRTHIFSAITATPATLVEIPPKLFQDTVFKDSKYMRQVFEMMSSKIRLMAIQSLQLSFGTPMQRICDAFIHLGLNYGKKVDNNRIKILITFTHQELADLIGATRVTVVNNLQELIKKKIISKENRYYFIEDISRLKSEINKSS